MINNLNVGYFVKPPKPRKSAGDKSRKLADKAIQAYQSAYREVYSCAIECIWIAPYVKVKGVEQGVSINRLQSMTKQLVNRKYG